MWIKVVIIIGLLAIAVSLFSALRMMSRNQGNDREKMARYLTLRVSLSVGLLVLLAVAYLMGWVEPHGINAGSTPLPNAPVENLQPVNTDEQK